MNTILLNFVNSNYQLLAYFIFECLMLAIRVYLLIYLVDRDLKIVHEFINEKKKEMDPVIVILVICILVVEMIYFFFHLYLPNVVALSVFFCGLNTVYQVAIAIVYTFTAIIYFVWLSFEATEEIRESIKREEKEIEE